MEPAQLVVWAEFIGCIVAIGLAGTRLSLYGDIIAEKTGLSGSWIGLVLLATATSLPELITGISSVTLANAPNITVGDVLGSCVFNLSILVVIDFLSRDESIYRRARQGHVLSAAYGIALISFVGANLLIDGKIVLPTLGHVGLYSPVIVLLYFAAMRSIFLYEREQMSDFVEDVTERYPAVTLRAASLGYVVAGSIVAAAGVALPFVGADIAAMMGWSNSFVGTLLVAATTSLPELAVTIGALRLGAIDMAIANLLGSNLFDIVIIAIDDVAFLPGPILSHVSPIHGVSALSAVIMSSLAIVGLFGRTGNRVFGTVGWVSLGLFAIYVLNSLGLYLLSE
ncbi:sodium:calcium antiporter [Methylotetracoccus oryzae]|uniref:sodium:calcium antiporter n=1 Tax=Methylotetracoccus oryzae TaxID=1919059 RepID=UPI001118D788|nr:sodium:calcium antiporter [Methylotetracoccus oryzae]